MPKILQLAGQKFGRLSVIDKSEERKGGLVQWNCVCDCGNAKTIPGAWLVSGNTRSCGCLENENRVKNCTKNKYADEDLVGFKFGRITVAETYTKNRKTMASGVCECGSAWNGPASSLVRGRILSCGCLTVETTVARVTTHGMTRNRTMTREYKAWQAMNRRCYDKAHKDYPYYGARGITVSDAWRDDPAKFHADMGDCPEGYTLDRIDNGGPYCKENCRWASRKTQANNSRKARMLEIDGVTKSVSEWVEQSGVGYTTVLGRLNKGWLPEAALSTPPLRVYKDAKSKRTTKINKHPSTPAGAIKVRGLNA